MNRLKLFHLFVIAIATLLLVAIPVQSEAATKGKHKTAQSTKERLVLMPLRVPEEDKNLIGAMETALVNGLQQKYDVFSGEQVSQKARQIFMKESQNTAHKECDETRCMQNIAEAFQAELIATANVTKQDGSYFLALSIQNIFDNKVVQSESLTCEKCTAVQVVDKLKELSRGNNSEASEAAMAAERKAKAEELKQEQLAFEEKLRNADAAERKRLLDAKAQDDKQLDELKAQAETRRKSSASQAPSDFPSVESAIAEIQRLKESINTIETGYEKELAQTRKQVSQRYAAQLAAVDKIQRDEFESTDEFKTKQDKKRSELNHQRDEELARLNPETLGIAEISPLRDKIKSLSEREYIVSAESLVVNLGAYDADAHQFPVSISSKVSSIHWNMSGAILLPIADAKVFKRQWVAGLVRAEVKLRPTGEASQLTLINDADNSRMSNYAGRFLTSKAAEIEAATAVAKAEEAEEALTGVMIRIPGKNYEIGKFDVTQKEWRDIMGGNPSKFTSCGDTCPVEQVSWNDVHEFIQKLNAKTGKQYRLPIEEEWEYACYGGSQTEYCGGSNLDSVAWYIDNSNSTTHPVGQKQANGYGLYDMSGNVWQWMENEYGGGRALRGGSWYNYAVNWPAAYRLSSVPSGRNYNVGFRLARTLP